MFSLKIQLTPIHRISRLISMSKAVACDSQAVAGASKLLKIGCRRDLVQKFAVLDIRTLYSMNCFLDMVDNIHQKHIWRPWNQCGSIGLHMRRLIWNSRVHERSGTSSGHEGTPAWTKAKPSSSRRSHRKTYRPAEARIYHSCLELAIFIRKGSVHMQFRF